MAQSKKGSLGDIFEVQTSRGLAYLQYTHEESGMGSLVRILPGLHQTRPANLANVAAERELFSTFYTLRHAIRNGDAKIVSHQPIPSSAKPWPMMRSSNGEDHTGKTLSWKILPADTPFTLEELRKATNYRELTPEQQRISIREPWTHRYLVERLAEGWTPARAEEFRVKALGRKKVEVSGQDTAKPNPSAQSMRHYLYFPTKKGAEKAAQWFGSQGLPVDVRLGADGKNWLALVKHQLPESEEEVDKLRDEMEAFTAQSGGEYDGWEIEVPA